MSLIVQNETIPAYWNVNKQNIKILCIRNSKITEIATNAFNTDAFKRLLYLELDGITVNRFRNGMFNGLTSLKVLILRNLKIHTFQFNSFISNQNSAFMLNKNADIYQSLDRNLPKRNYSSVNFEILYLIDNSAPLTPWIVVKKIPVILITILISSLFSFSLGLKLSFTLMHTFIKIYKYFKKFIQDFENDAAAMFIRNDIIIYTTVKKIRKVHFHD